MVNLTWTTLKKLKIGRSMKITRRRLGTGIHQLFALKDANGNVTNTMEVAVRVAEKFCKKLYSDQGGQEGGDAAEVKKALKGDFTLNKLANIHKMFSESHSAQSLEECHHCTNSHKGDIKDLKNYRAIQLTSSVCISSLLGPEHFLNASARAPFHSNLIKFLGVSSFLAVTLFTEQR